jgi:hypothetical protein
MSFSPEWRKISNFQALHLPALDARPGSDFLFTFLNDAGVDGFAPVSRRHIPTYSRGNMQEDFANAVAGYMHYPYMRASHPARYQFLREKVFGGKEYFPANKDRGFSTVILADFQEALKKNDYARVEKIFTELSRGVYPKIEKEIVSRLAENMESDPLSEKDLKLGLASCYLSDPEALKLRRDLVRKNRVPVKSFLKNEACARISPKNFEGILATWPPAAMYFYIENGKYYLQFLDPVLRVANARGFHSRYLWRAFLDGGPKEPFAQGNFSVADGGNGAVKIDLAASSGGKISFPEGVPVLIELGTERMHTSNFKTILSNTGQIRFVVHPGFKYRPDGEIKVRAIYPMRPSFKHQG